VLGNQLKGFDRVIDAADAGGSLGGMMKATVFERTVDGHLPRPSLTKSCNSVKPKVGQDNFGFPGAGLIEYVGSGGGHRDPPCRVPGGADDRCNARHRHAGPTRDFSLAATGTPCHRQGHSRAISRRTWAQKSAGQGPESNKCTPQGSVSAMDLARLPFHEQTLPLPFRMQSVIRMMLGDASSSRFSIELSRSGMTPASRAEGLGLRRENEAARALFAPLAKRYDFLAELLSFGQNARWHRRLVEMIAPSNPATVLDVATGTGLVAMRIAGSTTARVVGADITEQMLTRGKGNVRARGLDGRVVFGGGAAERLPFEDSTFDALTFTYLLRYVEDPAATLRELARVVKPEGNMAGLDFFVPPNAFWRACWKLYARGVLPAAGALLGRGWFDVGRFLGPSISEHYRRFPLCWHLDAWRRAGMADVDYTMLSLGGAVLMWGTKRDG
jgi:demethylmenaquinone methyltransferase / 2-methoxy-6-polyprenyl-1,4-benzoquinol methylase